MPGPGSARHDLCSIHATHAGFLRASRDPVQQFGSEGAWFVTGHCSHRTGVAQ